MEKLRTVGELFQQEHSGVPFEVTVGHKTCEDMLRAFHGNSHEHVYSRYNSFLARWYASEIMSGFDLTLSDFRAKVGNCGMAIVSTLITSLVQADKIKCQGRIVLAKELYSQVPVAYSYLKNFGVEIECADSGNLDELIELIGQNGKTQVVHLETVGNGWGLPVLNVEGLMRKLWEYDITLIIDGTFTTLHLVNPFEIFSRLQEEAGEPQFTFVYMESMTKYYRAVETDLVSAGLVIGPLTLMDEVDKVMAAHGTYLQLNDLRVMPAEPAEAAERVIRVLSEKAEAVANWLRHQSWVAEVSYPELPAGGVLFFKVKTPDKETFERFCNTCEIPKMGSFGHSMSTIIPYGSFYPDEQPGIIRLAIGFDELDDETISKLKTAAKEVFGS